MRQMRPTPANVKEDCCIDILGSTQIKFDVKVQLQDLPFPTPFTPKVGLSLVSSSKANGSHFSCSKGR